MLISIFQGCMEMGKFLNGFHYTIRGEGKPVVLIHGLLSSINVWEAVAALLLNQGFKVVMVDLPGHGMSDSIKHRREFDPEKLAARIKEILAKEGIRDPLIVSHSFGSQVVPHLRGKKVLVSPHLATKKTSLMKVIAFMLFPLSVFWPEKRRIIQRFRFNRKYSDFKISRSVQAVFSWGMRPFVYGMTSRQSCKSLEGSVVVHGTEDTIVPISAARAFARGAA